MSDNRIVFDKIDALWKKIRENASEPEFSTEVRSRERTPNYGMSDSDVLQEMIEVIAYSQAAPADRIGAMINRGVFRDVFGSFDPSIVGGMNPENVYKNHWAGQLSPMRFPDKIDKMVDCAKSLQAITNDHGSFMKYLAASKIPERISSTNDIDEFWGGFNKVCEHAPPYFQRNFISMCHLLQTFRFPCAKPDKVVMTVAAKLGIVNSRNKHPERELRDVVRFMQSYAVYRRLPVPMVDLIFLIHGKQTWAKSLVRSSYFSC